MRTLDIRHHTRYRYSAPVTFLPHRLFLRPREGHDVRVVKSMLVIEPTATVVWHRDASGNSVAVADFQEPSDQLAVLSEVTIEHYEDVPYEYPLEPYVAEFPFQYDASDRFELTPYQQLLFAKEDTALRTWVSEFWQPGNRIPTADLLAQLNSTIPARFAYNQREEPGVQRPAETLALGAGSCRDFATLFMETCRFLGLAARFVSGYLHAPDLPAALGATHAWTEVYLPGTGWRGYDSTTGNIIGADHITVAVSRHPENIPPVSGAYEGNVTGVPDMTVDVNVALAG